jgi:hypothetical protein
MPGHAALAIGKGVMVQATPLPRETGEPDMLLPGEAGGRAS